MPDYDSTFFNPPAPVAFVTLKNSENNQQVTDVPMLLDTGADATLLPRAFVAKLDIIQTSEIWEVESFDGTRNESAVVRLQMVFENKSFRGDYLLIEQDYGIIGRNILNFFNIRFDGKNLRWEIL